ncbi:ATR-interacting protein ATM and [Takifugu flavidus]|uniref:ATR-interacting protein ATM and n=1 Tax=Takifugu flavidus TaxID=433684 RepID=A0A5C6N5I7_9TELE|nr:ATR-interacting protein ATM and [Takifugu flavidus]
MNCPPSKRPRRLNDDLAQRSDDPFGDEEDFTQDDLDEIDVIASQAFPQGEHRAQSRPTLKEVEEEIMSKNGEIHVLRDSLKGAQQEKEAQRQTQLLLEIQRQKEQSDKEKELNKKVQSLQTELQFKEAEINEIKSKLHSSEKKKSACLLSRHSPKMQSVLTQLNDGSGSSTSPVAGGFITKEIFDTRVPSKEAPGKTGEWEDRGSPSSKQETSPPDPFMSKRPAPPQFQGSILLGLLLQQPLSPSSLGLCHLLSMSSGLGAVLLLPLLDYHLCRLSERLESHCSATAGRVEGTGLTGFSVEEIGLAALRLLYLLVSHSDEVVEAVLSKESLSTDAEKKDSVKALCSQNALLQSVLQLCEGGIGNSIGSHMEKLVLSALETLCVLIQRARHSHVNCLKRALQRIGTRFSTDCGLRMASDYVRVLMSVCEHPDLAQHLCFQHDHCVFLKLFQFIRTRRDNQAKQEDWVVRLLSRMMMQLESWLTRHHSSCHCHTEMVQTMVIVFHRQWLDLCGSQQPTNSTGPELSAPWWHSTNVSLLRECLLLLHWLLLHHSSFSQSCRPLLHLYDQVIPAVQDILRRIPERSESEEVALEEICRSDGDEADDLDIDTVS